MHFAENRGAIMGKLKDKNREKSKKGAKELEEIVRKHVEINEKQNLHTIVDLVKDEYLHNSSLANKQAGLLALSSIAMGISHRLEALGDEFAPLLIEPVVESFKDADTRIRFHAGFNLITIMINLRECTLSCGKVIYDGLARLITDTDEEVRKIAGKINNQLIEIVREHSCNPKYRILSDFISTQCKNLRGNSSDTRLYIIRWIKTFVELKELNIIEEIPMFLADLLMMVGDLFRMKHQDGTVVDEVQELLVHEMRSSKIVKQKGYCIRLLNVLTTLCRIDSIRYSTYTHLTAIQWIVTLLEVILLEKEDFMSQPVLPRSEHSSPPRQKEEEKLMLEESPGQSWAEERREEGLVGNGFEGCMANVLSVCIKGMNQVNEPEIRESSTKIGVMLLKILHMVLEINASFDIEYLQDFVLKMLNENTDNGELSDIMEWLRNIVELFPYQVLDRNFERLIDSLVRRLNNPEERIVQAVVDTTAKILSFQRAHYKSVMQKIVTFFYENRDKQIGKSKLILEKFCQILDSESVFLIFAEILGENEDSLFIKSMVQSLDILLCTNEKLRNLRGKFRNLNNSEDKLILSIFETIYKVWCHDSVSAITLCLLSEQYEVSYVITQSIAQRECDIATVMQVSKLVQLIESPYFAVLRMHLLEQSKYPYLVKTLYGLLMLLPQSKAFDYLKKRLKCSLDFQNSDPAFEKYFAKTKRMDIDIEKLIGIYERVSSKGPYSLA